MINFANPKNIDNFAHVIELERHIEILLLSNDCVIVPNLGGFMAHHVDARYDERDYTFLPPLRTLGFNPKLRLNDSLLALSYVDAYDISYPDALARSLQALSNTFSSVLPPFGFPLHLHAAKKHKPNRTKCNIYQMML